MEGLEHQNVNMTKMLDPKAQWPKTRGWGGRDNTVGLELLELAKLASTRDLSRRPDIVEVCTVNVSHSAARVLTATIFIYRFYPS